jgi:hypothetical protein
VDCVTLMYIQTETSMLKNVYLKKEKFSGFLVPLSSGLTTLLMKVKQTKQILLPIFLVTILLLCNEIFWLDFWVKCYFIF